MIKKCFANMLSMMYYFTVPCQNKHDSINTKLKKNLYSDGDYQIFFSQCPLKTEVSKVRPAQIQNLVKSRLKFFLLCFFEIICSFYSNSDSGHFLRLNLPNLRIQWFVFDFRSDPGKVCGARIANRCSKI